MSVSEMQIFAIKTFCRKLKSIGKRMEEKYYGLIYDLKYMIHTKIMKGKI